MLYRRGDPVMFCLNGQFQHGFVRDDEQLGSGLIDVVADDGIWYGLSRRTLTPLPRTPPGSSPRMAGSSSGSSGS